MDEVKLLPCEDELVERVARAIAETDWPKFDLMSDDDFSERERAKYFENARAAIEATRPTLVTGQLESFELFKLRGLLARLDGEDAEIVQQAIIRLADLEHQHERDCELWNSVTVSLPAHPQPGPSK